MKNAKKVFLFIILICNYFFGISQNWTSEELQQCNTAINNYILTHEEKEVIKYLNLARLYPQKFANIEVKDYLGPAKYGNYLKTSTYKESLLVTLQYKTPVGLLYFDESMYLLANCFAIESGETGKTGHTRSTCPNGYDGECCAYGPNQGKEIALQLLIDHDVPSLGHRDICLDGVFDKVGVSIKPHSYYEYCSVLDFKRKTNEYVFNNQKQNKSTVPLNYNSNQPNSYVEPKKTYTQTKQVAYKKNKLLSFKIGAGGNYLINDNTNFNSSFENNLSYQLNGMIGFNLGKSKKKTALGLFCNYGKYNTNNPLLYNNLYSSSNTFLEIEGGFLIKEFFRISGGLGYSLTNSINLSSNDYTSISVGFSLGPKWLKFDLSNSVIVLKNNQKISNRPSLGISLVF